MFCRWLFFSRAQDGLSRLVVLLTERLSESEGRLIQSEKQFIAKEQVFRGTIEEMYTTNKNKEAEFKKLQAAYLRKKDDLRRALAQLNEAQSQLMERSRRGTSVEPASAMDNSNEAALSEAQAQIDALQARVASLCEQLSGLSDLMRENERLRGELVKRENEIVHLANDTARLVKQLHELRRDPGGAHAAEAEAASALRIAELEGALDAARREIDAAGRLVAQYKCEVAALQLRLALPPAEHAERVATLERTVAEREHALAEAGAHGTALGERLEVLVTHIEAAKSESARALADAAEQAAVTRRRSFFKGFALGSLAAVTLAAASLALAARRYGGLSGLGARTSKWI